LGLRVTPYQKQLLDQVTDEYVEKIFYYICIGDVKELTPQTCENLMKKYLDLQNYKMHGEMEKAANEEKKHGNNN
jgi:hypothetical protein